MGVVAHIFHKLFQWLKARNAVIAPGACEPGRHAEIGYASLAQISSDGEAFRLAFCEASRLLAGELKLINSDEATFAPKNGSFDRPSMRGAP